MLEQTQLDSIFETIKRVSNPSRMYLFGSYASGTPHKDSDVDILVLKDKVNNKPEETLNLEKALISKDYSVDILFYSEDEFALKQRQQWRIFSEILAKGKQIAC